MPAQFAGRQRTAAALPDRSAADRLPGTCAEIAWVERVKQRVSTGLDNPAAELADCRVDKSTPERAQAAQRPGIIQANEPTIVGHVSANDSDEPSTACGLTGDVRAEPTRAHWDSLAQPDVNRQSRD